MIDFAVVVVILFFALIGACKGFVKYFMDLIITLVAIGTSWFYYQQRPLILTAFVVFIWIFLCLWILKWFLLRIMKKEAKEEAKTSFASRTLGAVIGAIWGIVIAVIIMFTISILPSELILKGNLKEQVQDSSSWSIFEYLFPVKDISVINNISYMSQIAKDRDAQMRLFQQEKFQDIMQHKSFKAIMDDPESLNQLKDKDLRKLLTNPKNIDLLNDGKFIEKLLTLDFKQAIEQQE